MKLIAIDLDGTLLSGNKMISNENAEAIRKCQEAGHVVAICTGRSIIDIERLLLEVNLECQLLPKMVRLYIMIKNDEEISNSKYAGTRDCELS